jgi:hypothetical protein
MGRENLAYATCPYFVEALLLAQLYTVLLQSTFGKALHYPA